MGDKKIVVPEGFFLAVKSGMFSINPGQLMREVPTVMCEKAIGWILGELRHCKTVEDVRRMFLAPEPEVDRIDFYIKTANGDFVPWTPTEGQRQVMGFDDLMGLSPEADRRLIEAWNRAKDMYSHPEPCSHETEVPEFDPENVGRWPEDGCGGDVVDAEDYEKLLELYRSGKKAGAK